MASPHPFSFPFPPYPIQLDLMHKLDECMQEGKTGIFESPTGTGKSLSVLCATLSWLEANREEEERKWKEKAEKKIEEDPEEDWLVAAAKKRAAESEQNEARDEIDRRRKITERIDRAKRGDASDSRRWEKRKKDDDVGDEDEEGKEEKDECLIDDEEDTKGPKEDGEEKEELRCPKIFYASRTHSQLTQIMDELAKTRFRPRVVTLASRSMLCANEEVLKLKANHLINERCMELRRKKEKGEKREAGKKARRTTAATSCELYKADAIEDLTDGILAARITTPSAVLEEGRATCACPYFASRRSIALAELVLLPYQVLLHESARSSWGIDVRDSIVVIDEAHNVVQTIGSLYSAELPLPSAAGALALLRQYVEMYRLRLSPRNLSHVRQLISVVAAIEAFLRTTTASKPLTIAALIIQLNLHDVNLFELAAYMERVDLCRKLHGFYVRSLRVGGGGGGAGQPLAESQQRVAPSGIAALMAKKAKVDPVADSSTKENKKTSDKKVATAVEAPQRSGSPLFAVKSFLDALCNPCADGRVLVDAEAKSLKFILLNPGARLAALVGASRCTLLVGGTMEPAGVLVSALKQREEGAKDSIPREVDRFACSHVVPEEHVLGLVVGCGVDGRRIELRMENRGNEQILTSLARTLLSIVAVSPAGTVIFFPSYAFLDVFVSFAERKGIMGQIKQHKEVFVEKRGSTEGTTLLEGYSRAARGKKGAVLLAIVGGRLSEGINFNDELGRCVVVVGLPYANRGSVELQERMKYLDSTRSGAGNELYESLCWHAVNQAVGRALRHRGDWASIILLDARFTGAGKGKISGWLAPRLVRPSTFADAEAKMREFYSRRLAK